jgi:hypothetical protein
MGVSRDRFATSIVSFNQGGGGGLFDTNALLSAPTGGGFGSGSLDVLTLGIRGDVTLGFDVDITNGPQADFTVDENVFLVGSNSIFAEYGFIEVSTNGVDFARFPNLGLPSSTVFRSAPGLAGGNPCLANVFFNSIDPFDPVVSGGDSFDLAELSADSTVTSGMVDLNLIRFVRLVNASLTGADFDAVAVIQHTGNQVQGQPSCDLYRDAQGFLHLVMSDPNGLSDLDLTNWKASINFVPIPLNRLRRFLTQQSQTSNELHLVPPQPLANYSFEAVLSVSLRDFSGGFGGDQQSLNY